MTAIKIFLVTIAVLFIGALAFVARRSAKNNEERSHEKTNEQDRFENGTRHDG
jgi:hypothetical protein